MEFGTLLVEWNDLLFFDRVTYNKRFKIVIHIVYYNPQISKLKFK